MNDNFSLHTVAKEIKAKRFKTVRAIASRLNRSDWFVRYRLKPALILLQAITSAGWRSCVSGRHPKPK